MLVWFILKGLKRIVNLFVCKFRVVVYVKCLFLLFELDIGIKGLYLVD